MSEATGSLIAPTINYGVNLPCDRSMPGTTSISEHTLRQLVLEITDWWRFQGFLRFFLLTFHGDPFHIKALSDISDDIFLIETYEVEYTDVLEKQSTMRHACEAETSIALYLYPDKVRMSAIEEHDIVFEDFKDYLFHERKDLPKGYIGCLGYPKAATAKKGEILVKRILDYTLKEYYKYSV